MDYARKRQLENLVEAHHLVNTAPITREEALAELAAMKRMQDWLNAEANWQHRIAQWLQAEAKWRLQRNKFDDETYAAAKRGWTLVKKYVPKLDGVTHFEDLSESHQFRHAAFAAAVLGLLPPPEVKSSKQLTQELR